MAEWSLSSRRQARSKGKVVIPIPAMPDEESESHRDMGQYMTVHRSNICDSSPK
jgi:hypothetical protein